MSSSTSLPIIVCDGDDRPKGVVGTLMSNLGLEQALADKGIELVRAKVETATCSNKWQNRDGLWAARPPDILFVLISPRPAMASWPRSKLWRLWPLWARAFGAEKRVAQIASDVD